MKPLTSNHKVIFAGNPLSYGAGRTLPSLFARHGHTVMFRPFSEDYIRQNILQPIFVGIYPDMSMGEADAETPVVSIVAELIELFLQVYKFFSEECKTLITPRELQMMALIFRARIEGKSISGADCRVLALEIAHRVSRHFVPKEFLARFDERFKIIDARGFADHDGMDDDEAVQEAQEHESMELDTSKEECGESSASEDENSEPLILQVQSEVDKYLSENEFLCMGMHVSLRQYLEDIFAVRAFKQSGQALSECQRTGGLGGLIIEGEPGLGKSQAVLAFCKEKAIEVVYIPASLQSDAKIKKLQEAFYNGRIVVIDEINSSPMLERLMNDLLMGRIPADWKTSLLQSITPGFTLIATQNPIYMAGRSATSTAVEHRTMKVILEDYSEVDAVEVLTRKYKLDAGFSAFLVKTYSEQKRHAQEEGAWPAPNFRDLCKRAHRYAADYHYQQYLTEYSRDSFLMYTVVYHAYLAAKWGNIEAFDYIGRQFNVLADSLRGLVNTELRKKYYTLAMECYLAAGNASSAFMVASISGVVITGEKGVHAYKSLKQPRVRISPRQEVPPQILGRKRAQNDLESKKQESAKKVSRLR